MSERPRPPGWLPKPEYDSIYSVAFALMSYTIKNLREVEDVAPRFGFDTVQEVRFARRALGAEDTGFAYHVIKPGQRGGAHRHEAAEEIYVVIAGSGRVNLDGEVTELRRLDAILSGDPWGS